MLRNGLDRKNGTPRITLFGYEMGLIEKKQAKEVFIAEKKNFLKRPKLQNKL